MEDVLFAVVCIGFSLQQKLVSNLTSSEIRHVRVHCCLFRIIVDFLDGRPNFLTVMGRINILNEVLS